MIGDGIFSTQLEEIEKLLKRLKLFEDRQLFPNVSLGASAFKGKTYRQTYELAIAELAYNFRLTDQSLFFFTKTGESIHDGTLNFIYYEAAVEVVSYETFLSMELALDPASAEFKDILDELGDEGIPDYEQYISSSDIKAAVTPLRFDCKAADYRAGIHPAAHLHFGVNNDIRLGTRRILGPLAFVLFVIRQHYPSSWQTVLMWADCDILCRQFRTALEQVDAAYWGANDERELHLT